MWLALCSYDVPFVLSTEYGSNVSRKVQNSNAFKSHAPNVHRGEQRGQDEPTAGVLNLPNAAAL